MGVDVGYWIYQTKGLTMSEMNEQKDVPLRHWCGDHSRCGPWCISKVAVEKGQVDHQKAVFDLTDEEDKKTVEMIREIQDKFWCR